MNQFKYIDYNNSVIFHKSDYRTANTRSHHFLLSTERNFIPKNPQNLCNELKNVRFEHRPRSESNEKYSWKINPGFSERNLREDPAPNLTSVRHNCYFADKVKSSGASVPLRVTKADEKVFTTIPKQPTASLIHLPFIEHSWKEAHFTNTDGYFPHADPFVSVTELDFHDHLKYATARTNVIVRKELSFNWDVAYFIPKTKLINQNALCQQYAIENIRDKSKFTQPSYDRIIPQRMNFVKNFGLSSEMSSKY